MAAPAAVAAPAPAPSPASGLGKLNNSRFCRRGARAASSPNDAPPAVLFEGAAKKVAGVAAGVAAVLAPETPPLYKRPPTVPIAGKASHIISAPGLLEKLAGAYTR